VIQVQVANPYGIEIRPIELVFGHAMRRIRAAIQQQRAALSFHPETSRSTLRMKDRCA
jgi:hypothetical protein